MSIFIVFAIGSDDIFVFMDAYTQSQFKGPAVNRDLETRMSWACRKSGSAMLITSATICAPFLCCLETPIAGTQSFGLFAALIIAIDYLLVMMLFCSAVMVYHNHFEMQPLCGCSLPSPCWLLKLGCCTEGCDFS
jgi:predicted RND superfamily exporter protein